MFFLLKLVFQVSPLLSRGNRIQMQLVLQLILQVNNTQSMKTIFHILCKQKFPIMHFSQLLNITPRYRLTRRVQNPKWDSNRNCKSSGFMFRTFG